MKKTYQQIRNQIQALEREAEALKRAEINEVIKRIREAITVYNLSAADLGFGAGGKAAATKGRRKAVAKPAKAAGKTAGRKVPIKFRDDAGNTWTGRGNQPRWLRAALAAGRKLDDFRV